MFKIYSITSSYNAYNYLDAFFQRVGQARKIRRFCITEDIRMSGNYVLFANPQNELRNAYCMWEIGCVDYVVITSRRIFDNYMNDYIETLMEELEKHNALLVLDEFIFI